MSSRDDRVARRPVRARDRDAQPHSKRADGMTRASCDPDADAADSKHFDDRVTGWNPGQTLAADVVVSRDSGALGWIEVVPGEVVAVRGKIPHDPAQERPCVLFSR